MRIIARKLLNEYAEQYPQARSSLDHWHETARAAQWNSPTDLKRTLGNADHVRVRSRKTVRVFNIQGNEHRLIAAVHFNTKIVYTLRLMPHDEYDENRWKDDL